MAAEPHPALWIRSRRPGLIIRFPKLALLVQAHAEIQPTKTTETRRIEVSVLSRGFGALGRCWSRASDAGWHHQVSRSRSAQT